MKALNFLYASIGFFILALVFVQCQKEELITEDESQLVSITNTQMPQVFENNLSFPVIWSDGYPLELNESPDGQPMLEGEWWYVWGDENTIPTELICSCKPHSKRNFTCEDGSVPGDGVSTVYKAYLQKRSNNLWRAETAPPSYSSTYVDLVDWGDQLELRDWDMNSKVPTQLALYENLDIPMLQFQMKHVTGWGTNRIDGLKTTLSDLLMIGPGDIASVYSHNVRLTIQKLNVFKDSIPAGSLRWEPINGWTEIDPNGENIINEPIFNEPVYETNEGPDCFNATVNTSGKIVYGCTWDVSALNQGDGYYRLTYSFDDGFGEVPLNTFFDENTQIMNLNIKTYSKSVHGGGVAQLDTQYNLTYMDILVKKEGIDH